MVRPFCSRFHDEFASRLAVAILAPSPSRPVRRRSARLRSVPGHPEKKPNGRKWESSPTFTPLESSFVKYRLLAIGKPKLDYAAAGIQDYAKRLKHYVQLEIDYLKDRNESEALLSRSKGSYRIALDERGTQHSTASLTKQITQLENRGDLKAVSFLVGGADGHSAALRDQCDQIWSLSSMTMQHELALVVLLEQIYRVFTIKRGEPYHRE